MSTNIGHKLTKQSVMDNITRYLSASAIIILLAVMTATQDNFLSAYNLKNLLRDPAPLLIMAAGMTMVLIIGGIDLSMGAVCSVSNVLYVRLMLLYAERFGSPVIFGIICTLICLVFGALSGLALGLIQAKLKVPSFIASLGFMSVWQSVALLITPAPEVMPKVLWPSITWYKITVAEVIGLPLLIAMLLVLAVYALTKYTAFGKSIYAIGGNERTARISGINVEKTKVSVFVVSGMLAALAGVFLIANLKSSSPSTGEPYTLQIVASCALGGTSLAGGKGSVLGTILGVFTVAVINNSMTFVGIDAYWQNVVFGAFVLGAIALTVDRKTRGLIVK
ncbi:ABC transporter permease [uncultured Oscillibacter sp.]|uniref:ABC transporter permease n=1 Tax=uncultured Oscillibacter sp. TaxID=876091 RepID=UPI0025D867DC|nr:ABC transporter permease [uncultured Oscillibacter sp.]